MTVEAPIAVLFALILGSEEDLTDARDRAITLAAGMRLSRFTREEAEVYLWRVYGHIMPAGDCQTVARWMASL